MHTFKIYRFALVRAGGGMGAIAALTFSASDAFAFNCTSPAPVGPAYPCYVAFIHGSGTDDSGANDTETTWNTHAPGTSENYWWSDAAPYDVNHSFTYAASGQHIDQTAACAILRVTYDGTQSFFNAAHQVASAFNNWFCSSPSPNQVVVVSHSMGGLVMRWLLNHGANPQSAYYTPLW